MENQKLSAERLAWIKEHYSGEIDLEMDHARAHIQLLLMHIGALEAEKTEIIRNADALIDEMDTTNRETSELADKLENELSHWKGYAEFLYSCAAAGMQPESFEQYMKSSETTAAND